MPLDQRVGLGTIDARPECGVGAVGLMVLLLAAAASPIDTATQPQTAKPNRLIHESSPYLLLHAYNPVDWYPWGEEALERARRENRPIFLSVGYSTCYWCHVMERDVFSEPRIAALMNLWFVNIKVDREERPDIDEIYMVTTQLLTGRGGWPNSVFLTPDLEPFFAGTYFPPADQPGRPGFPTVLRALHGAWSERRTEIVAQAGEIAAAVRRQLQGSDKKSGELLPVEAAAVAVEQLKSRFDQEFGGFGQAPKFPSPANLLLLWHQAERGDEEAEQMVLATLHAMGRGAIYDQLGGGFHRYTLDSAWRIPHFEKMLYDNALLVELLAMVVAATSDGDLERLLRGTLEFLLGDMALDNGAFKSAIDAETAGVEGAFYTWSREELEAALGGEEHAFLGPILGFAAAPNFEGERYTLYLTASIDEHSARAGLSRKVFLQRLEPMLQQLHRRRGQRPLPLEDDKVLTDWNGMAVTALALSGKQLGEKRYLAAASQAAEFLLTLKDGEGVLLHVWRDGQAKLRGFLDDYAFLTRGLLALHEATGEERWLREAERLGIELERRLREPRGGYYTGEGDATLLVRARSAIDGAIPAGNGIAALNLLKLAELTGKPIYHARAAAAIAAFGSELSEFPSAFATIALAAQVAREGSRAALETLAVESGGALEGPATLAQRVVGVELRRLAGESADGWIPFAILLKIEQGWHVNANPPSSEFLIPTQVEGTVRQLDYPQPESLPLAFAEEEVKVYSGEVTIRGEVAPTKPALRFTYQACDDRRCLPPVTRRLELPPAAAEPSESLPTDGRLQRPV